MQTLLEDLPITEKLTLAIVSSSLSEAEQAACITKINNGTFNEQDFNDVLQLLRTDIESMATAQHIMESEPSTKLQNP